MVSFLSHTVGFVESFGAQGFWLEKFHNHLEKWSLRTEFSGQGGDSALPGL